MANINEVLRYLSEVGKMREADRLRRSAPETLLNIASTLEQLKGFRQQREFAGQREPLIQEGLDLSNIAQKESIEDVKLGRKIKQTDFDYTEMTKQLRQNMPGVVEQYGSYTKGDKSIKDVGLTPNPLTRTVQGLIESGQTDLARRAEPEVFAELTKGIPESVRAARERAGGIGKNKQLELALIRERHNLEVERNKLKDLGRLKVDEFETLNNMNEFLFKISQGEVQVPLLLEALKAGEKLTDDYGSEYKKIVEGLRDDYEKYKAGEMTEEELAGRVSEKYGLIKEQLDISTEETKVDIETGKPIEKPEEPAGEFDLTDKEMKSLPTISANGLTWRQVIRNGVSYIYAPNSKKPAFQVSASKWGELTDEQKAKVLKAKGF